MSKFNNMEEAYLSLQDSIKRVILEHLRTQFISESSLDNIKTGNFYQSIRFGDEKFQGFRSADRSLFLGIDLTDAIIIDYGCNLGEMSREAARRGAARVKGIEYDRFFTQVGRYITAHNGLSQVTHICGDITKADTYNEDADISLVLSVFTYAQHQFDLLAKRTKWLLLLETHAVKRNWAAAYIPKISSQFPHVAVVGVSDHKEGAAVGDFRLLILGAREPLGGLIYRRSVAMEAAGLNPKIEIGESALKHVQAFAKFIDFDLGHGDGINEIASKSKEKMSSLTTQQMVEAITSDGLILSPLYWCCLFAGYAQAKERGQVDGANIYVQFIKSAIGKGAYDQSYAPLLARVGELEKRLSFRFAMIDKASANGELDPIVLFNCKIADVGSGKSPMQLKTSDVPNLITAGSVDGHHRLVVSALLRRKEIGCYKVWYPNVSTSAQSPDASLWEAVYDHAMSRFQQTAVAEGAIGLLPKATHG